jgi:hypothetical protein
MTEDERIEQEELIEKALYTAAYYGWVECECGNRIEPDGDCCCGRENLLKDLI